MLMLVRYEFRAFKATVWPFDTSWTYENSAHHQKSLKLQFGK